MRPSLNLFLRLACAWHYRTNILLEIKRFWWDLKGLSVKELLTDQIYWNSYVDGWRILFR